MTRTVRNVITAIKAHVASPYVPDTGLAFVIIFLRRTGSNLLASLLDSHPEILCHHELFAPDSAHRAMSLRGRHVDFGTAADRDADPFAFLRRVYAWQDGRKAVGFKLAPGQSDAVFLSLLVHPKVKKIVLRRAHWLHAYTSEAIAAQTNIWSVPATGTPGARRDEAKHQVRIEVSALRRFVRRRRLFHKAVSTVLQLTRQPFLTVDYEDLHEPDTHRKLALYLGVNPGVPMVAGTVRQNPARLSARISNMDELRRELDGTYLGALLNQEVEVTQR